jgi:hypothetical protein
MKTLDLLTERIGDDSFVSVDGGEPITWAEFVRTNPDADIATIYDDLSMGQESTVGGGAAPIQTVKLL